MSEPSSLNGSLTYALRSPWALLHLRLEGDGVEHDALLFPAPDGATVWPAFAFHRGHGLRLALRARRADVTPFHQPAVGGDHEVVLASAGWLVSPSDELVPLTVVGWTFVLPAMV